MVYELRTLVLVGSYLVDENLTPHNSRSHSDRGEERAKRV